MTTKECKYHGLVSGENVYDRTYKGRRIIKCKLCINDKNKKYYDKLYQDDLKAQAKRDKDNKYWKDNKEKITEKRKAPARLALRRDAYHRNADYYREKCNAKQKAYRENLHDSYIKKIIQDGDKNISFNDIPQSLIDFKRTIMNFKKSIRETIIQKKAEKDEN